MKSTDHVWTSDDIEKLARLWLKEGMSASLIAVHLGVSKSAIIGKIHRLKLGAHRLYQRKPRHLFPRKSQSRKPRVQPGKLQRLEPRLKLRSPKQPQQELTKSQIRQEFEQAWANTTKL